MSKKKNTRPAPAPSSKQKAPAPVVTKPAADFWWFGLIAAALGMFLYARTIGYNYCLDDFSSIKENWVVKGGLKNLGTMFSTEYRYGAWNSPGSLYRPIPLVLFSLEWQFAPDKPWLGHFVNMLLYGLTGWALWITWRRILANFSPLLPALAVLFFLVLPVHTEVASNIKSSDEMMSLIFATFSMYSIWRYFENNRNGWLVTAVLLYAGAMFSKEGAITFLAILPLTIWFFTNQTSAKNFRIWALMLIPGVLFLLIRKAILDAQPYPEQYSELDNFMVAAKGPIERFASAFMMCGQYLYTMIFPVHLVSDQGYPQIKPINFSDLRAWGGLLSYAALFIWAALNLKKKHFLSYCIFVFLFAFAPFSNIFLQIGTSYGERLLYLPSLGYVLALAWIICKVFKIDDPRQIWNPNGKGSLVWGVAGALLAVYGIRTLIRIPAWQNSESLYSADIAQSPNSAKLNYHYGLEKVRLGMDEKGSVVTDSTWVNKGIDTYSKAIQLYPKYHDAYGSRGLAYFRMKKYDQAFEDYQKSLEYRPNDSKTLSNVGFIYFMRNQFDKAEEVYKKSIQFDPRFVDARRNLGAIYAMKKEFPAAIEQWQEGLKYEPTNATLLFYIGSAYNDMGQPDKAQPWFEKAYAIEPSLKK
jgi:hypothetical protein